MLPGVVLELGLIAGLYSGLGEGKAQEPDPISFDALYFPWVPSNRMIDGAGPWYGSITVQNVDVEYDNLGVRFWVLDGATINRIAGNQGENDGGYGLGDAFDDPDVPRFDLDPGASITLSAANRDLAEPGSPVAVFALYKDALAEPVEFGSISPRIAGLQKQAAAKPMSDATTTSAHLSVDGYSGIRFSDVAWGSQSDFCYMLRDGVDSCDGTGLHELEAQPEAGFDGHSYLPIVQTNADWNTEIYLSNVDFTAVTAAQTSITLTESDQHGSGGSGIAEAVETVNIPPGGTAVVDVRALVGDEWVGSARITSTVGVSSVAMRSKPPENMLMINTSAPSLLQASGTGIPYDNLSTESAASGAYHLYAPLVFRDYNGWNTGFSFVNIAERPNRVTVSYVGQESGNRVVDTLTIPPRGQRFVYIPATQDLDVDHEAGDGFVGAAHLHAEHPFHVAIDQVKYSTGEAMSYLAAAAGAGVGDALVLPLVQKGWLDGSGDTSGFQVFNPDMSSPVTYELRFYDSAGTAIEPTRSAPFRTEVGPREVNTVYTMQLSGMAQNQRASAVLTPVDGEGWLTGVSNNVNYSVTGDGSAAFHMVNLQGQYRLVGNGDGSD